MQGFAFGLPVAFAAALIVMVAVTNPLHSPSGFHAVAPARPGSTEIVSQLERREAVRTISQDRLREAQPARSVAARLEAGCSVCHTL
jgi:hypothetical protein